MKVKVYNILDRAIEEGVAYGYNRAYKHTDTPTPEQVMREIETAVMNEICEVFDLSNDSDSVKMLNESDDEYRPF